MKKGFGIWDVKSLIEDSMWRYSTGAQRGLCGTRMALGVLKISIFMSKLEY
jgi:hypothetical protein